MAPGIQQAIFRIKDERTFRDSALEVFHLQARSVPVYRDFLAALRVDPERIAKVEQVPFLPVEFFKTHRVIAEGFHPEFVFESSGTTHSTPSRHLVADLALYRESFTRAFTLFYGDPSKRCILALLPSYLERKGSSLVAMMDHLIRLSGHPGSGFYLDNLEGLSATLDKRNKDGYPTLLLGVSFALLQLAEKYPMKLGENIIIMETGGMKGRGRELVRSELHTILADAFGKASIHSEYGMTELLSQAYSCDEGIFRCPPWMRVLARDPTDPLTILEPGEDGSRTGGLNIIDLANLNSCSFIATGDLGRCYKDGSFEVLGRFDHAEARGCNLLI
jgi:phenylacetate-coenzyme A ligase PaaK-like adenylate-forming protein